MSKLSKAQTKLHDLACELLKQDSLTLDQRAFVLEHWHPGANHNISRAGAFFTPPGLADVFAIECNGAQSVIDLCAGIGGLSYARWCRDRPKRLVCVEANPAYVAVGRKVLPEAEWIQASVFNLPDLGHFELAISNPPYGHVRCEGRAPRYRGNEFEYRVIDVASTLADQGVFLIPQTSAMRRFSGEGQGREMLSEKYQRFHQETGITLDIGLGIDTALWRKDWKGTQIVVESVRCDFREVAAA